MSQNPHNKAKEYFEEVQRYYEYGNLEQARQCHFEIGKIYQQCNDLFMQEIFKKSNDLVKKLEDDQTSQSK